MSAPLPSVQDDFDRIAAVSPDGWNHSALYHGFLLRQLPRKCRAALDVGCGTGTFSRRLAERCDSVLGLDLSAGMVEAARERSRDFANLRFEQADAMQYELGTGQFDCVASIATLHHLPMEEALLQWSRALQPRGTLLVLDLYRQTGPWRPLRNAIAVPLSIVLRLVHEGRLREPEVVRQAWAAHGNHDVHATLPQVGRVCARLLPGARVRSHLLWRYSIVWKKP